MNKGKLNLLYPTRNIETFPKRLSMRIGTSSTKNRSFYKRRRWKASSKETSAWRKGRNLLNNSEGVLKSELIEKLIEILPEYISKQKIIRYIERNSNREGGKIFNPRKSKHKEKNTRLPFKGYRHHSNNINDVIVSLINNKEARQLYISILKTRYYLFRTIESCKKYIADKYYVKLYAYRETNTYKKYCYCTDLLKRIDDSVLDKSRHYKIKSLFTYNDVKFIMSNHYTMYKFYGTSDKLNKYNIYNYYLDNLKKSKTCEFTCLVNAIKKVKNEKK
jgi:hypothetical protein